MFVAAARRAADVGCREPMARAHGVISETLRILPASNIPETCADSSRGDHQDRRRSTGSLAGYYTRQLPTGRRSTASERMNEQRHEILLDASCEYRAMDGDLFSRLITGAGETFGRSLRLV